LLLDATVVRMFLVPSVMKLLGDDCWWAPMWMKRLQNRLGLGEIHLPDERKKPAPRARAERPAIAARTAAATATKPPPPHDPTHPGADAPPRQARPAQRGEFRPPAQDAPSAAGTTKMQIPGRADSKEAPTTRFSAQPNTSSAAAPGHEQPPAPPQRDDREIESWLSDLRGAGDRPAEPYDDHTRAIKIPPSTQAPSEPEDATTAIPTPGRDDTDSGTAAEKMSARDEKPPRPRRGGGLSAADLLRREGRM
jgi:trehalose monomycolate/heme transporter